MGHAVRGEGGGGDAGIGPSEQPPAPRFLDALALWWKLGWLSFGGPAGQIALMHAELVERRGWVSESAFLHGLNYSMLLPGPEATQLAAYLGWRLHGVWGGVVAGGLFVLPGALVIAVLAWVYMSFGDVPAVAGVLLGLQAGVLAIIAQAVIRIGKRVLRGPLAVGLAVAALFAIGVLSVPFPMIIASAALVGWLVGRFRPALLPQPAVHGAAGPAGEVSGPSRSLRWSLGLAVIILLAWWLPVAAVGIGLGTDSTGFAQALFFSKAAVVTFGGAYAVLPYVAQQAVEVHQWLAPGQMMVGLGLAETTPGPLILVLEFVGFVGGWQQPDLASPLVSALLGAAITVWVTFVPSFLFVLPVAPWIERLREWPAANAALTAITAAVVGVIANLALWFGWSLLSAADAWTVAFVVLLSSVMFAGLVWRGWSVLWVVPACAAAGLLFGAVAG
ncbi:chromate efflux transporter [Alkalisalibacterium limincola]|uniref:Chromate efflux transporter n=1 Tax=Alkalisalibacterium limincola TaxID=2699169 RepID=A0A5C8KRV7_9GAMM|nr:chromate efflux transporter [Alkalisalibacterium limincola]TXK62089.1 chromate efflux transporter [Alkalisalibacterium limincola]